MVIYNKIKIFFSINYVSIIGFALFFVSPILSIPYHLFNYVLSKEKKVYIFFSVLLALSLGFIAYCTVPLKSDDLYRHYENMSVLQNLSFFEIFKYSYEGVYVNTIIMYLISLTGNFALYPTLYVSIGFLIVFLIIKDYSIKHKINKSFFFFIILFFFFSFFPRYFISGLRNHFAYILCFYIIYKNLCLNKKNIICDSLLFFIAFFIHTASIIIMICFSFYLCVYRKFSITNRRIFLGGLLCFFPIIFLIVKTLPAELITFFNNFPLISKVILYISTALTFFNVNLMIMYSFIILFYLICIFLLRANNDERDDYIDFCLFICVFSISFFFNFNVLTRLIYILILLICPLIIKLYSLAQKKEKMILYCFMGLITIAGIIFLFSSIAAYPWYFKNEIFSLFILMF